MLAPLLAQCPTPGLAPLPGRARPTGGPAWPGLDRWPGDTEYYNGDTLFSVVGIQCGVWI